MNTKEILQGIKDWAAPKIIYDISAAHNNTKYTDLSNALGTNGGNIPQEYRKGGMSVKFVQSSDNKYVQYRCMADSFNTTPANWQGVDDEPTAGSNNLVKSGGVADKISDLGEKVGIIDTSLPQSTTQYRMISDNQWVSYANYHMVLIPVNAGDVVSATNWFSYWTILSGDDQTIGSTPQFASGEVVHSSGINNITIPSDGKYMSICILEGGVPKMFDSLLINGINRKNLPIKNIEDLNVKIENNNGNGEIKGNNLIATIDEKINPNRDYAHAIRNSSVARHLGIPDLELPSSTTNYRYPTETVWVNYGNLHTVLLNVNPGDIISIPNWSSYWCFLKNNNTVVGSEVDYADGESMHNEGVSNVVVPDSANYMALCILQFGTDKTISSLIINGIDILSSTLDKIYAVRPNLQIEDEQSKIVVNESTLLKFGNINPNGLPNESVTSKCLANHLGFLDISLPQSTSQYRFISNGVWVNYANYHLVLIPVNAGDVFTLNTWCNHWGILKDNLQTVGTAPHWVDGDNGWRTAGVICNIVIPEDGKYVALSVLEGGSTQNFESIIINGVDRLKDTKSQLESIVNSRSVDENESMVWFGTSIPCGTNQYQVRFKGKNIKYLSSDSNTDAYSTNSNSMLPVQYPIIVGKTLGVNAFNEAVGGSTAKGAIVSSGGSYATIKLCMGNTVAEKLDMFFDCWSVNWEERTFDNGERIYGFTNIPTIDNWEELMDELFTILRYSFQIKLVCRYLISDTVMHNNYVQSIFGDYYENISENININSLCDYRHTVDLFVLDHGTNDNITEEIPSSEINSTDLKTFVGAMNTYINLIYSYRPSSNIVILSMYGKYRSNDKTIEAQSQICDNRNIPFINVSKLLPYGNNIVKTQGYWDGGNNSFGYFHDTGFTFTYTSLDSTDWTTNDDKINMIYNQNKPTASVVIAEQGIVIKNGTLYHSYTQRNLYFKDDLHPHTDRSGNAVVRYANVLSNLLQSFFKRNIEIPYNLN